MGLLNFLFGKKDNTLATVVPSQVTETEREGKEPPEIKNRIREIDSTDVFDTKTFYFDIPKRNPIFGLL